MYHLPIRHIKSNPFILNYYSSNVWSLRLDVYNREAVRREEIIIVLHKIFFTHIYFCIHKICSVYLAQNTFFQYHSFLSLKHFIYLVEIQDWTRSWFFNMFLMKELSDTDKRNRQDYKGIWEKTKLQRQPQ